MIKTGFHFGLVVSLVVVVMAGIASGKGGEGGYSVVFNSIFEFIFLKQHALVPSAACAALLTGCAEGPTPAGAWQWFGGQLVRAHSVPSACASHLADGGCAPHPLVHFVRRSGEVWGCAR